MVSEKIEEYKKWHPQLRQIVSEGMSAYVRQVPDLVKAFENESDNCLDCIDEGIKKSGGIRVAGSGILMTEEELNYLKTTQTPTKIMSHQGCGAAKQGFYNKYKKWPSPGEVDGFAEEEAQRVADFFGVRYEGQRGSQELHRPSDLHIARVIYLIGSKASFNPLLSSHMPPGFVISYRLLSEETIKRDLSIGIGIAFDPHHGFGDLLSETSPLLICCIGEKNDPEYGKETISAKVGQWLTKGQIGNKEVTPSLKVDGFSWVSDQLQ